MQELRLSTSAIQDFNACSLRYLYKHIYKLQPERESDSQRRGIVWHRCHEILEMTPQGKCPDCFKKEELQENCPLCEGKGTLPSDLMDAVVRYLNQVYAVVPPHKTHDEWETERITILYSLSGYRWLFPERRFKTLASEVWFQLPIIIPGTKRRFPKSCLVGKIDALIQDNETGLFYARERKSTSHSIEGTKYWGRLAIDKQVTNYLRASRIYQALGRYEKFGIMRDDPPIANVFYDVWRYPDIGPKKLTQADSKTFVETGEYCGEKFNPYQEIEGDNLSWMIDGQGLLITAGAKERTFSIFETPEMFGARLLQDIAQRPEFYYAQREIPRHDQQLADYEDEIYKTAQVMRYVAANELWCPNDRSCESPYKCPFKEFCYAGQTLGPKDIPEGFTKYIKEEKQ